MPTPQAISGVTTYDNVRTIDAIVDEGESGVFANSARLVDQVLRDARIFSTVMTRIGGLLGKPREYEPAEEKGVRKDTAARLAKELESEWEDMFPHDQLVELMIWGLMQNAGVAQIIEDPDCWKLDVWHPSALTWDEYERNYWIQTREEPKLWILPDGKGGYRDENGTRWVLFTPFGFGNTRRNYLRCIHRLTNERQWAHRDRARFSEIFGQGIRLGIAPKNSTDAEVTEYKRRLRLGGEPVIVARQGVEGEKWGLELIQADGSSSELFDTTLTQLDKEIATLFLGQSQTTDGQAGLGANEMAGEPVRLDMMSADNQALGGALRSQFLAPYYDYAYGNGDLAPWPCWRVEPAEDGAKKSLQFKQAMEGIAAAKAAGIPIDERAILEDFGYPMVTPEEQAKIDAENAKKAADAAKNQPNPNNQPAG